MRFFVPSSRSGRLVVLLVPEAARRSEMWVDVAGFRVRNGEDLIDDSGSEHRVHFQSSTVPDIPKR